MKHILMIGTCIPAMAMMAASEGGGASGGIALGEHTLAQAINALDVARDDDWTSEGEPAMLRIKQLTGNDEFTRKDVRAATPEGFNRANAGAAPTLTGDDDAEDQVSMDDGTTSPSTDPDAGPASLGGGDGSTGNQEDQDVVLKRTPTSTDRAVESILQDCFGEHGFDAVVLMEAVTAAASADRFRRNNALQNLVRGFQVSQAEIKELQGRLDARIADRSAKNKASRAATLEELQADGEPS